MESLKIFTLVPNGQSIKIKCMYDPRWYLMTSLARTIDSHPNDNNAYAAATKLHQHEVDEIMKILGILYTLTRHNSSVWVKEKWLCEAFKISATAMKRYLRILEHGIRYKGAGMYIKQTKDQSGEIYWQINNYDDENQYIDFNYYLDFLKQSGNLQTGFPTMFVAEHPHKIDNYTDTYKPKNTTLEDVGEINIHNIDEEFKTLLAQLDDKLIPTATTTFFQGCVETHFERATQLW